MADVDVLDNNFIYVWLTTSAGRGLFTNVLATEVYIRRSLTATGATAQ